MKKGRKVSKKTKKKSSQDSSKLSRMAYGGDGRNVLFRPSRFNYVRKVNPPKGCVFCQASEEGVNLKSLCVYKTNHSMILLNKFPYNSGHLLILPIGHMGDFLTLEDSVYEDLQRTLRLGVEILTEVYRPAGVNLGMNLGAAAGAGIPDHLHYHLVPRWAGDLNFFPLIAGTKVVVETLEETYRKVLGYLNNKVS